MNLLDIINEMRVADNREPLQQLLASMHLRDDLAFDSLKLAELTVRIEDAYGIDIFADSIVQTIGDIENKLEGLSNG